MAFLLAMACAQLVGVGALRLLAGRRYSSDIAAYGKPFQLAFLAPASLYALERSRFMKRFPRATANIHRTIVGLYGSRNGMEYTKLFAAQTVSLMMLLFFLFTLAAMLADGSLSVFGSGLVLVAVTPFLMRKQMEDKLKKKKRDFILELPELLNKVTLLVNAGETVQNAVIRCTEQKKNAEHIPLYKELLQVKHEIHHNVSFAQALEQFSKRCGVQEVSIFTTTVLLNYRRGGDQLVIALRELSRNMWDKRKAMARTLGEEASSKLVFPMVFIFVIVMVIVSAPALLYMGQ